MEIVPGFPKVSRRRTIGNCWCEIIHGSDALSVTQLAKALMERDNTVSEIKLHSE